MTLEDRCRPSSGARSSVEALCHGSGLSIPRSPLEDPGVLRDHPWALWPPRVFTVRLRYASETQVSCSISPRWGGETAVVEPTPPSFLWLTGHATVSTPSASTPPPLSCYFTGKVRCCWSPPDYRRVNIVNTPPRSGSFSMNGPLGSERRFASRPRVL